MWTDDNFNPGALKDIPDSRDLSFGAILEQVGADNAPSWEQGFDLEQTYGKLVQKDQNGSLSCTSQATAYYGEILEKIESSRDVPFSARAIYSEVYLPQGAAYVRDAVLQAVSRGFTPESLCASYPNDEQAMRVKADPSTFDAASVYKAKSGAAVTPGMEYFCQALFAGKGLVTAFTGSNPAWHPDADGFIRPPKDGETIWGHCVFIVAYGIHNGRKGFKIRNSWGAAWGDDGCAWVGEDYFTAMNSTLVFSGWTLVDLPDKYQPEYMFNLVKGSSPNVYAMGGGQKFLIINEYTMNKGVELKMWDASQINQISDADLGNLQDGDVIVFIPNK